jgi:hypothetical protein
VPLIFLMLVFETCGSCNEQLQFKTFECL